MQIMIGVWREEGGRTGRMMKFSTSSWKHLESETPILQGDQTERVRGEKLGQVGAIATMNIDDM